MKALTISQPYASLIADGEKWIENRRWVAYYRGLLAIHAGKGTQYLDREELAEYPSGCIVAVAELVECCDLSWVRNHWDAAQVTCRYTRDEILNHVHAEGPKLLILDNVRKLSQPIPCRGAQGFWSVPADVAQLMKGTE